jgi:DNA (cytosine-5)-methyltransferase 1
MNKFKAISLFAGAGGDSLGMEKADIDVIGYVEYNKFAIQTHEKNFPNCKLIGENITKIPDEKFKEYSKITDIIFGGFPCQSFSHGGKKNPDDPRGFLYQEFVRVVNIVKPKIIIGENVKGILSRKMNDNTTNFIDQIIKDFASLGYSIKCNLFNMKNYGIPQNRERVLIYGIRNDLDIDIDLSLIKNLPPRYNKDILEFSLENALLIDDIEILDLIPNDKFIEDVENSEEPFGKVPTNLIKCYQNRDISFKTRSKPQNSCIIDKNDIARTIICSYGRMPRLFVPVANDVGCFLRPYTILELQQIQGFPRDFVFEGKYIEKINQIGNAIPPLFVTHVMKYIISHLNQI